MKQKFDFKANEIVKLESQKSESMKEEGKRKEERIKQVMLSNQEKDNIIKEMSIQVENFKFFLKY